MAGLQAGCVVEYGRCDEAATGSVVVGSEEAVGGTQPVPGIVHSPAESEQLSIWPFGERQSLAWELSQVPTKTAMV